MEIVIRPMTSADLESGRHLSAQAGWNQTETDWRRCLNLQADGCFVAERDGVVAGTATTCLFGGVAWVAMVLVDQRCRRQGIGRALMTYALDFLDARGVASVRLDATPLGQPLYEQLGFAPQFLLERWAGVLPPDDSAPDARVVKASAEQWRTLAALDALVTRTRREKLLLALFAEQPDEVRMIEDAGEVKGFLAVRMGAQAVQLGPCLGEAGRPLLEDACRRHAGRRVYLDAPADNERVRELAQARGLAVQRTLTRMCRGEQVVEKVGLLWASFGPEKG
jgi:GNAT superfamily N-acetyltransferase